MRLSPGLAVRALSDGEAEWVLLQVLRGTGYRDGR